MNGTLMFGGDRFGPDQDYAATYRSLGGSRLALEVVQAAIPACYEIMERIYNDPARCDSFPRVQDTLRTLSQAKGLDEGELKLLEDVIARHERGQVPDSYAIALRSLARSHPLGLVANILSRKRSEEHTSELQSRLHLVCRLLLEKKKKKPDTACARLTQYADSR